MTEKSSDDLTNERKLWCAPTRPSPFVDSIPNNVEKVELMKNLQLFPRRPNAQALVTKSA